MPGTGRKMGGGTSSLPAKLALFVTIFSLSLMGFVLRFHRAAFSSIEYQPEETTNDAPRRQLDSHEEKYFEEEEEENENRPPMNIVLFYADDWRHDTLGAAGNPVVETPVLDALAEEGVRFTENCVTTSICWVSRATLYSGQYLARHHFEMLGRGRTVTLPNGTRIEMKFETPQNETIYSILKEKGNYVVGHAGKLGLWVELDRKLNFDFFVDDDGWHWRLIGKRLWHITEKNTADALRFLMTKPKNRPFFLNVAYFATHAVDGDKRQYLPQNASMSMYENSTIPVPEDTYHKLPYFFVNSPYNEGRTRWRWRFDTYDKHQSMMKNYYRMASEVDTSVGIILKHLETKGELNNTLIIFTTDNGNFHAEHGLADKWYPHQESIRVPLIISDPRMSRRFKGTVNSEFTLNIDLAATILGAAGLDPLESMMGRDMSLLYRKGGLSGPASSQSRRKASTLTEKRRFPEPAADGNGRYHSGSKDAWRTEFFYEHPMHTNRDYIPASEALVRKDFKYFYWPNFQYEQLFDLRNDPQEMNDLYNSTNPFHQEKLKEMRRRFLELKLLAHSDLSIIL